MLMLLTKILILQITMSRKGFQFAIDRGGTFTDVYARCPNGNVRVMKLLSVDPQNYDDAPREAIRRILQEVCIYLAFSFFLQFNISNYSSS